MHPFHSLHAAWHRAKHQFHNARCNSAPPRWFAGGRCGPGDGAGFGRGFGGRDGDAGDGGFDSGGPFGVRRPLRFLAYKLGLDEPQVTQLAVVLDTLKTERAQAEVDQRRTTAAYADLFAAETFDLSAAAQVQSDRVASSQRLQSAVTTALAKIHAILTPDQRGRLTYLLRTGVLRL